MNRGGFLNDFIYVLGLACFGGLALIGVWFAIASAIRSIVERVESNDLEAEVIQLFDQELHTA